MSNAPYSLQPTGERDSHGRSRYEIGASIDGVWYSNKVFLSPEYYGQVLLFVERLNEAHERAFEYGKRVGKLEAMTEHKKNLEASNTKLREATTKNFTAGKIDITGTSRRGFLHVTYTDLVNMFGAPHPGCGDKTRAEWHVRFTDGTIVAIYDWKWFDRKVETVTEWNVGGKSVKALEHLGKLFGPEKVIMG